MGDVKEYMERIRILQEEIREIHGSMRENPHNSDSYMTQLNEIDNEIIQLMDKIMNGVDGDTSTE
jgi:uncharacterized coiled-coil DUF342 family protein